MSEHEGEPIELRATTEIVPLARKELASVAPSYERMRLAIAECFRVDEIANLADQAVAAQAYYRQSQDKALEIEASRIRLRAERRLGEILKTMAANGEPASRQDTLKQTSMLPTATSAPTLADLGIPRDRASRAMRLADLPEPEFDAVLAESRIAQPRRILDERRPAAARSPASTPLATPLSGADVAATWVQRVIDLRMAIALGELPRADQCRAKLAAEEITKLRAALPAVIGYLEQVRLATCPRCDGDGCAHCTPRSRTPH